MEFNNAKQIDEYAFKGCYVESLTFTETLTIINQYAFYGNKLQQFGVLNSALIKYKYTYSYILDTTTNYIVAVAFGYCI